MKYIKTYEQIDKYALIQASINGHLEIVKELLKHNIEGKDFFDYLSDENKKEIMVSKIFNG